MMFPGDTVHYQPDLTLPGVLVMLLKYDTTAPRPNRPRHAYIAWWETGTLETPQGVVRHGYRFRRYRWVPLRHLGVATPSIRTLMETT